MDQDSRNPDDSNLDEEMERDTEIRRDTQVRGSLGIPPSGDASSIARDRANDAGVPEFERSDDLDDRDDERISER